MAHAICLQDWTTVNVTTSSNSVQNEDHYVDVSAYQDVALYVEIASITAGLTLQLQTSPTKDETFFTASTNSNGYLAQYTSGGGLQTVSVQRWASFTNMPLARFLRWKVLGGGTGGAVTFRIWLSLNQAGSR
jgi:hypothetical protein